MQNYILLLIAVMCWLGCSLFVWLLLRHVRRPIDDLGGHDVALVVLVALGPISVIAGYSMVFWLWLFPHTRLDTAQHEYSNRERP